MKNSAHVTLQRLKSRHIRHPTGLAVFDEDLFWTNRVDFGDMSINKIVSANKFLANDTEPTEIVPRLRHHASDLHIFHSAQQYPGK